LREEGSTKRGKRIALFGIWGRKEGVEEQVKEFGKRGVEKGQARHGRREVQSGVAEGAGGGREG
jgi:hypothetical protein